MFSKFYSSNIFYVNFINVFETVFYSFVIYKFILSSEKKPKKGGMIPGLFIYNQLLQHQIRAGVSIVMLTMKMQFTKVFLHISLPQGLE